MIDNQKKDLDTVQIYNKERKEDLENTFKQFSQREQDQEKNMLNLKVGFNSGYPGNIFKCKKSFKNCLFDTGYDIFFA